MHKQIKGIKTQWSVLEQVGKGDAGEVFKVCTSDLQTYAVLKRPSLNATGGSIIRQAVQIENEGRILGILDGVQIQQDNFSLVTPLLLDVADQQTASTAKYFIISQQAEGKSLSYLLSEARTNRKIFSRKLLLKVITSLFILFEHIHQKGILWNDVKADHIFWDEKVHSIMVIDWGNGVILNDNRAKALMQLTALNDYKQMINEFGRIIESTAPDLIWDIGWPQGQQQELDQNIIILLKKRVEFANNYFNLRIIEYHAKVKVLLKQLVDLETFTELFNYVNRLEQMGEYVDYTQVFEATKALLLDLTHQGKLLECSSILEQIGKNWKDNLEKEWEIIVELFLLPQVTISPSFPVILEKACQKKWPSLYWELGQVIGQNDSVPWWNTISRKIRSLVLPAEFNSVYIIELLKTLLSDIHVQTIQSRMAEKHKLDLNELQNVSNLLSELIGQWEDVSHRNFFGEHLITLRDLLPLLEKIEIKIDPLLKSYLVNLQQVTRQLVSAWNSADFVLAHKNLELYYLWDPQFKSSENLYKTLKDMEEWVKSVNDGPNISQDGYTFISEKLNSLVDIDLALGIPVWLNEITRGFNEILNNKTQLDFQEIKKLELPFSWLSDTRVMAGNLELPAKIVSLSNSQKDALNAFYQSLKLGLDTREPLHLINSELPQYLQVYQKLANAFDFQLLPNEQFVKYLDTAQVPLGDRGNFLSAKQALNNLTNWAKAICEGDLDHAINLLPEESDWTLINNSREVQSNWQRDILPLLSDIKDLRWNQDCYQEKGGEDQGNSLKPCLNLLCEANKVWLEILEKGLNPKNVIALGESLDLAQQSYLTFMKNLENIKEMKLFLSCFGEEMNSVYRQIHHVADHARVIKQAHDVLTRDVMLQTRMAYNSASDILFSLTKLNDFMPDNATSQQVSDWVKTYDQVLEQGKEGSTGIALSEIDLKHPLYNWFQNISRTFHD